MLKNIVFIEKEELSSLIKGILEDCLKNDVEMSESVGDQWLTQSEAIQYLKISKPTFGKISNNFPVYRISEKRILFKKSDLDAFLESKKSY